MFVSGTTDTGAYTLVLNGSLSAPTQATPTTDTGSLSGVVFNDANSDGTQDNGETGLSGWTVFIDENGTGQFSQGDPTATTDANGTYTFTGLAPGSYTVLVETNDGYTQTTPASNAGSTVTVTAGQNATAAPFGESQQNSGTISGTVYNDANGNGVQDSGEAGIAGWYVYVDVNDSGQYVNGDPYAQTDANGNYSFQGVPAGTYTLRAYPEKGYTTTQGSNGETANAGSTGVDFGEGQPAGTITGVVYADTNGDFTQDDGETGLAGWQVFIDVGNTGVLRHR